ncbi:ThuA domain-containing protein [Dyadobacter sp. CY326]|uniref:ThuA domain-containing protein n=1 Tax=Dyadobacter sp. CY326 TaxID=2907300 RepID=UPI001F3181D6|nr:ThuA domain-containing protein [Dyadobacter sp. CY326]MCE7067031.1 ThuA domain-containing protein [Dyadobacter sp. CY326]
MKISHTNIQLRPSEWPVYILIAVFLTAALVLIFTIKNLALFSGNPVSSANAESAFAANHGGVLIFSKTDGFRHHSIEPGIAALTKECANKGWEVHVTENAAFINPKYLVPFKVVIFLSTTGEIFDDKQKAAFQNYMENGGGYVGIHSASDTEHGWEWYGNLLGTFFRDHTFLPHMPEAELVTETALHPATHGLPKNWHKEDEWYNFQQNVRGKPGFEVLLSLNEQSYSSVWRKMNGDHPISWTHELPRGRMFYTALGHNAQTFSDPNAMRHIMGGIQWAGRL